MEVPWWEKSDGEPVHGGVGAPTGTGLRPQPRAALEGYVLEWVKCTDYFAPCPLNQWSLVGGVSPGMVSGQERRRVSVWMASANGTAIHNWWTPARRSSRRRSVPASSRSSAPGRISEFACSASG